MNHHHLHWIAEQHHSCVDLKDMDFGSLDTDDAARRELVARALHAFPTQASLWAGSNEVVLHDEDARSNVLPFNRFQKPPAKARKPRSISTKRPRPAADLKSPGLKVHWRLKIAMRRQKQRLYLDLVWREESLQNAHHDYLTGVGDWAAVEKVHLDYIDKIRDANAFINAVWDDQEEYYWARSKTWQSTDSAWAYRVWMEAWEREIPAPSLPGRAGAADLKLDASKILRGIPDEPAE